MELQEKLRRKSGRRLGYGQNTDTVKLSKIRTIIERNSILKNQN
jgi:hypothetical protein